VSRIAITVASEASNPSWWAITPQMPHIWHSVAAHRRRPADGYRTAEPTLRARSVIRRCRISPVK
jgi:hypothetical protein